MEFIERPKHKLRGAQSRYAALRETLTNGKALRLDLEIEGDTICRLRNRVVGALANDPQRGTYRVRTVQSKDRLSIAAWLEPKQEGNAE